MSLLTGIWVEGERLDVPSGQLPHQRLKVKNSLYCTSNFFLIGDCFKIKKNIRFYHFYT